MIWFRYIVNDVDKAVEFYTENLDFRLEQQFGTAIAMLERDGATDEGKPGPRATGGVYAGYSRDLDGNKLNAFCVVK